MARRGVQGVAVLVALALAQPAWAEEPVLVPHERGALTGLGLAFLAATLLGTGVGIAGVAGASDGWESVAHFGPMAPPEGEAPAAAAAQARYFSGIAQASISFTLAVAALVGSIVCFVVDGKPAAVSFVPTPQGGAFAFSLVW
ncbi:MAG: hypothetical protein QM817_29205 [Archangium sp.]